MDVPLPDLRGLAAGEIVVAFVERGILTEGDEVDLAPGPSRPEGELRPAYRRWAAAPPEGAWTAIVAAVHPAALLDPDAGRSRHLLTAAPTHGDLVVLRVFGPGGAVLSDVAFAARRRSVEGALAG